GPYLRWSEATRTAVRELGLLYHSSQALLFDALPAAVRRADADLARALRMYSARPAEREPVRPRLLDGLVDIPVALPDDEIMVERLGLGEEAQTGTWLAMLATVAARGELLTLQLHPERILECESALRALLHQARHQQPPVWVARLDEIAAWW